MFSLDEVGNPLVAPNRNYARYEVRINRPEFDSIVGNKSYIAAIVLQPHDEQTLQPRLGRDRAAG